ncbi:MAG: VOC family protein [Pseudomonadota bacterium]
MTEPTSTTEKATSRSSENILYLDNIGLIVLDLDKTRNIYERLGFNLAARGTHYLEGKDGEFYRWGTANHCVNFRDGGLLEFIGHYYPDYPAGLYSRQLEVYGNHWGKITLHTASVDREVERIRADGLMVSDPSTLYRYTDGEDFDPDPTRSKRTRLIGYPTSFEDPFMLTGGEHKLGQWPIPEEHFDHANGTDRMVYALIGTTDLDRTCARYETATGIESKPFELGRRIDLGQDTFLYLVLRDKLPSPLQDQFGDRTTLTLGAGFEVKNIAVTKSVLESTDIQAIEDDLGLTVYEPVKGSGTIIFLNGA